MSPVGDAGPVLRNVLFALVCCSALTACIFFRDPADLGQYALCIGTRDATACGSRADAVAIANSTHYWDVTRNFSGVVDGVGTVVRASNAFGMKRVGNIAACIPSIRDKATRKLLDPTGHSSDPTGFHLAPGAFVRLENAVALGDRFTELLYASAHMGMIYEEKVDAAVMEAEIQAHIAEIGATCRNFLLPGAYVITRVLMVENMSYTLHGRDRSRIQFDEFSLRNYVRLDDSIEYSFQDLRDGTALVRASPVYVALADAVRLEETGAARPGQIDSLTETLIQYCTRVARCAKF